jgi:hypothetical protein
MTDDSFPHQLSIASPFLVYVEKLQYPNMVQQGRGNQTSEESATLPTGAEAPLGY